MVLCDVEEARYNLNMLITAISLEAKCDRRTMRREKETARLHGKWRVYMFQLLIRIGFCHFICIASLIFNWNPEAAVSRIVKHSVEQDSASLRWSNVFVDMRSLVRCKVLTDASGKVASRFPSVTVVQHKETCKFPAIGGLESRNLSCWKNAQL